MKIVEYLKGNRAQAAQIVAFLLLGFFLVSMRSRISRIDEVQRLQCKQMGLIAESLMDHETHIEEMTKAIEEMKKAFVIQSLAASLGVDKIPVGDARALYRQLKSQCSICWGFGTFEDPCRVCKETGKYEGARCGACDGVGFISRACSCRR